MKRIRSETLFAESKKNLVGGVNSPVRAYRGYDLAPPFIERAEGAYLWDADGNRYIDYVGSWGPMILGHAHPAFVDAIKRAAEGGTSYGAPTEGENGLALIVKGAFPSIELIRFVSSGTEAAMSAIRVARGFTGRDKIIKFNGCYHGHADHLLVKAGSGGATFSIPDSAGVPADFARHTLVAEYNDLESVERLVGENIGNVAAVIVEPVAGNMGCVPPEPGFLEGLRRICDRDGIILIFDEVITGFRVAFGGAQELYGVRADITCLGKILGGGLPMGAYGGRREIMECVSPLGPVYQAGTLSGNPVAVAAGIATLEIMMPPLPLGERVGVRGAYKTLDQMTKLLADEIDKVLAKKDIPHTINRVGSMFTVFFTPEKVINFSGASGADRHAFDKYFIHMLESGIYLAPSPYESAFVGLSHTKEDIETTVSAVSTLT